MKDNANAEELMKDLRIVLVRTNYPENIGMAARASANFGGAGICLAEPRRWDLDKALPTATRQGEPLLRDIRICSSLAEAVEPCSLVIATTARTGGVRRHLITPHEAAAQIARQLQGGGKAALVFGPEDKGLSNEDLQLCGRIVTIPTAPGDSSLNLAQAVLLMMYECFLACTGEHGSRDLRPSRMVSSAERMMLFDLMKRALVGIGTLPADNPDYFFLPLASFFDRAGLHRHEFDIFMGICHRVLQLTQKDPR